MENYQSGYDFHAVFGRDNYECVHPKAERYATAGACLFLEEGMNRCPHYSECPYVVAREQAKLSSRASLNYAYWLHVHHTKWPSPGALVCDEAHQLPDLTLEWAGIMILEKQRVDMNLPMFPFLRSGRNGPAANAAEMSCAWLSRCIEELKRQTLRLGNNAESTGNAKQLRRIELMAKKMQATLDAMRLSQHDWYIRSGPGAVDGGERAFVAKPLTARHHFRNYFLSEKWKTILMSATIGDADVLARELGLTNYSAQVAPSAWEAKVRPVQILDVPRLGRSASYADWGKQADEIAKAIKACPRNWSGLVHVVSIKEASNLAQRLAERGLSDRMWVPPRISTDGQIEQWRNQMQRHPGSIAVGWSFWEGYDGTEERINICAKVPYPYLGDPYEIERRNYDGTLYNQRAAWGMEQALGRVRRGRAQDYDLDGQQQKLVAIADGSWNWIKKYFSPTLMESLVKL